MDKEHVFSLSSIDPVFNKKRQCLCMFCSKLISEGSIIYHQSKSCKNSPTQNKLKQFNKIIIVISCDDKISNLSQAILKYFKFSDVFALPILFNLYDDHEVGQKTRKMSTNLDDMMKDVILRFNLFRWKKVVTNFHFIVLSSYKHFYHSDHISNDTKLLQFVCQNIQSLDIKGIKFNLICFFDSNNIQKDPLLKKSTFKHTHYYDLDQFPRFMFGGILSLHFKFEDQTFCHFLLSKQHRETNNINPLKLAGKNINRTYICESCTTEIPKLSCVTKNCPQINKLTPCLHCSELQKIDNYKRHEKTCKHALSDLSSSEFLIVIGVIGNDDERSHVYAQLLAYYYPKAFIMRINAQDLSDFSFQFLRSSIHKLKYFKQENKGRIFIFIFENRYPQYQVLNQLFSKCENLIHIHINFYSPTSNLAITPFQHNDITPNTSLSYFNNANHFCSLLSVITMCDYNDAHFLCNEFNITSDISEDIQHHFINKHSTCSFTDKHKTLIPKVVQKEKVGSFGYLEPYLVLVDSKQNVKNDTLIIHDNHDDYTLDHQNEDYLTDQQNQQNTDDLSAFGYIE
jgi:hypothetical protein